MSGSDFCFAKLIGTGGGLRSHIGNADAEFEQVCVFAGMIEPGGESGLVEGFPEAVARTAKVVADDDAVEAGIYAAEEDF